MSSDLYTYVNFSASFICQQILQLMELEFNIWKYVSFVVTSFMLRSFGCKKFYVWRTSIFDTDGIPYIMVSSSLNVSRFGKGIISATWVGHVCFHVSLVT